MLPLCFTTPTTSSEPLPSFTVLPRATAEGMRQTHDDEELAARVSLNTLLLNGITNTERLSGNPAYSISSYSGALGGWHGCQHAKWPMPNRL
jgi:hypothetical protein